jgi:hypothetical protein
LASSHPWIWRRRQPDELTNERSWWLTHDIELNRRGQVVSTVSIDGGPAMLVLLTPATP